MEQQNSIILIGILLTTLPSTTNSDVPTILKGLHYNNYQDWISCYTTLSLIPKINDQLLMHLIITTCSQIWMNLLIYLKLRNHLSLIIKKYKIKLWKISKLSQSLIDYFVGNLNLSYKPKTIEKVVCHPLWRFKLEEEMILILKNKI